MLPVKVNERMYKIGLCIPCYSVCVDPFCFVVYFVHQWHALCFSLVVREIPCSSSLLDHEFLWCIVSESVRIRVASGGIYVYVCVCMSLITRL